MSCLFIPITQHDKINKTLPLTLFTPGGGGGGGQNCPHSEFFFISSKTTEATALKFSDN